MIVQPQTVASQVTTACERLGVAVPRKLAKRLEHAATVTAGTGSLGVGVRAVDAVVAAIDRGVDPVDDELVRRALASEQLVSMNIAMAGREAANAETEDALAQSFDAIAEAWRPAIAKVSTTLIEASQDLPPSLDDTAGVVARGPDASAAWATSREALAILGATDRAWSSLAEMVELPHRHGHHLPLRLAPLPLAQLGELQRAGKVDAWMLAKHSVPVDFPTPAEWLDRVEQLDREVREQRQAEEARKRNNFRGAISVPARG